MSQLMSDTLREALNSQWSHEIMNSHIYLHIMAFLKNKGFDRLAMIFKNQYSEEQEHAQKILDLMTDLNTEFHAFGIEPCELSFNSIVDIAKAYLEREILTTESLKEIRDLAIDEGNVIVEEKMREMIGLQQREMDESLSFFDRSEVCGSNWMNTLLWDISLKE